MVAEDELLNENHDIMKSSNQPLINLNLNVSGLSQSATLQINELSRQLMSEGRRIYRLGLGQSPFPVPQVVQDELKANTHQKDYLPVLGLPRIAMQFAMLEQSRAAAGRH